MHINTQTAGIYLHIPFCVQKCRYCDFCSVADSEAAQREQYVRRLCEELACGAPQATGATFDSVYFGGGTPTRLTAEQLCRLLERVRAHYCVTPDAEITLECNPATADEGMLRALRQAGFNRLSIGAQSFCDCELAALGRVHNSAQIGETVAAARAAGFSHLSLDLMYGIPHQSVSSLRASLLQAIALDVEHLSVYSLIIEEGTPFARLRDSLPLPSEETLCEMSAVIRQTLADAGYAHYEISNYARAGCASVHNLHYWSLDDYLGFGVAAHSLWRGVRTGHRADLAAYLDGQPTVEPEEVLTPEAAREEYVMLRLRLAAGVDKAAFAARFGVAFDDCYAARVAPFVASGHLYDSPQRLCFSEEGMEVSNFILSEILFETTRP